MLEPGKHIGEKYRLVEPIGQGGMATVWRAEHVTLGRAVAIKFLVGIGTNVSHRSERFIREARVIATVRHRHVVDVLDFGVTEEGQPYMVMELLEGVTLSDRLAQGPPLSDALIVDVIATTLSGLAAVHDLGIVHRDLKPENIFLVEDADGLFPKLIDFGVSRGFDHDADGRLTGTGGVVGTPQYMSPEQARGMRDIDARSDIFSMGTVLYECLTGTHPFQSENPGDILIMIVANDLAPPESVRPDIPPALAHVIEVAMQKDRAARWQSAREMREALLAARDDLSGRPARRTPRMPIPSAPTLDRPETGTGPASPAHADELPASSGRRRTFAVLAIVAALGLGAGALAMLDADEPVESRRDDGVSEPAHAAASPSAPIATEDPPSEAAHAAPPALAPAEPPGLAQPDPARGEAPARPVARGKRESREQTMAERPSRFIRDLDY